MSASGVVDWIGKHGALAYVLVIPVAFAVGRFTAAKPTVTTQEHTVYQDRIVYKDREVKVASKAEVKHVVVYRDRVIKDGTTTEHEVETDDTTAHELASDVTTHASTETKAIDRTASKTVTSDRPQWHVGILAGGSLTTPLLSIAGPLTLGVHAERRIAGPFWGGVWALSSGQAGASLSGEF